MTFDSEEGARISSASIKAITAAKVMVDVGSVGPELRDLVRYARELYELLLEQVIAAGPDAAEDIRGICGAMGNRLGQLEALLDDGSRPSALH